jgi:uncharacterized protein YvpB
LALGIQQARDDGPPPAFTLTVQAGDRPVARLELPASIADGGTDAARLSSLLEARLPRRWVVREGSARLVYALDRPQVVERVTRSWGESIVVAARPRSAAIAAPVVAQKLRNNCESAALEILLATVGVRIAQSELQAALPTDGPLDPIGVGGDRVWGDPEVGYVGRPEGGGVAGGFGVYQRPVESVARRYGVELEDLTGASVEAVYRRLLDGRAVMAWVGLSDGPYGTWTSPAGRRVRVNFGEHTVVLSGVAANGDLVVVNPLTGTRESWSRSKFRSMWELLDRRALATVQTDGVTATGA